MEQIIDTKDNGETLVQVATIGTVVGTNPVDGSPIEQNLTEEALQKMADNQKDAEILVDADHESELGDKTEAKGWLYGLFVKPGVGLFGKIKWTDIGRRLIENRVFRWLSPSWILDKETKEPMYMTSIALTNKPSQMGDIQPIVNSAPMKIENSEEGILDMTKEELVKLVEETVKAAIKEAEDAEDKEELAEEIKEELEEKEDDEVLNNCGGKKEVVNEEPEKVEETKTEEVVEKTEEVKEEEKKEDDEDDKEEVIKIEALNSAPKTAGLDVIKDSGAKWQTLSGKDFISWVNNGCK